MRRHAKAIVAASALLLTLAVGVTLAGATAPSATIDAPSAVSYTSAHLSGSVDPQDHDTYYSFEYSTDPETAGWSGANYQEPIAAGTGVKNVSADLSGLKPGTKYFVRLVANNFIDPEVFSPEPNPSFTTDPVALPSVSIDPITAISDDTAHFSGTINPNAPGTNPPAFDVNWHFECTPGCPGVPGSQTIAADAADHHVSVDASGLDPNTAYEVRLVAENAGGQQSAQGQASFSTGTAAPIVKALPPAVITDTSAWIGGEVNPQNSPSTYYIEYSSDPGFADSTSAPASQDASAGSGNSLVFVNHHAEGLQPATTYYYRVVASGAGTTSGETETFKTLATTSDTSDLPDGRVWERVSPALNGGGNVLPGSQVAIKVVANMSQAADSGQAVAYTASGHFAGDGGGAMVQYLARRGASGWSTEGISPAQVPGPGINNFNSYDWLSDDLSFGTVMTRYALAPDDPPEPYNLYLRNNQTGTYRTLTTGDPLDLFDVATPEVITATQDGSHVVFRLVGPGGRGPYDWADGILYPVAVMPDGTEDKSGANIGSSPGLLTTAGANVLSEDGSRIFFEPGNGALYVRENHTSTTLVSGSERAGDDPDAPAHAQFELASKDGTLAFFTGRSTTVGEPLTNDALDGLYRWDSTAPATERLTDITTDNSASSPEGGTVLGTVGASDDASYVYFVDTGKLTDDATFGAPNLYLWHEGSPMSLVATLTTTTDSANRSRDLGVWNKLMFGQGGEPLDKPAPYRDARVTPDGRFIAFASVKSLMPYDTNGLKQIYLYDSSLNQLTCASCGPVNSTSKGESWFQSANTEDILWDGSHHLTSNLSSDGKRLFFDSKDALVPTDTNGVTDVYEWHQGKIDLISSGTSGFPSRFLDASRSGDDVFFTSVQHLVPSDLDNSIDLYDARVGGQAEAGTSAPCVGDECQGTPLAAPTFLTPASANFIGKGTAAPRRNRKQCTKSRVRRAGRCVSKKSKGHRKQGPKASNPRKSK